MGIRDWNDRGSGTLATLRNGDILANRYKVLRFIGKGGMGEVYEAEDCELHERVALKTILPEIARQAESIQRFKREIQLARKVTHPNVCRIFDLFYHQTTIFLTMELLEGETLAQRVQRTGALSTPEAFPLVAQMAAGLAAAHQAGIIHRDFKSSNVMLVPALGQKGGIRAVIMDFGLARRSHPVDASIGLSAVGTITGTPAYMAPEQVEGGEVTSAADIFALGVVMYEMMTGRCPFEADTPLSIAVKRLQEPAPSPRTHNPSMDPRWEKAILRCLERYPKDRFGSPAEIIPAIQPQTPVPAPSEQPRVLEAAAPQHAAVGRSMQLLAMIRKFESEGLKSYLEIEEITSMTKDDVRAKPFRLEFPLDRKGEPQPAEFALRLDSPDFEPKAQTKKLLVPPDRDSEVCTFLLTPQVAGELLLNLEVLKGEVLVASRAMRTVAEITEQPRAFGPNVLVSIPLEVIAYGLRAGAGTAASEAKWPLAAPQLAPLLAPGPTAQAPPPSTSVTKSPAPKLAPDEFTRMFTQHPPISPTERPPVMAKGQEAPGQVQECHASLAAALLQPTISQPAPSPRPAPPLCPKAAAPSLIQPQPQVGALQLPRPKPRKSRSAVRTALPTLTVLLVSMGVGGLYIATRQSHSQLEPVSMPSPASNSISQPAPAPTLAAPETATAKAPLPRPEPAKSPRPDAPKMETPVPAADPQALFDAAERARARGDLKAALTQFKAIASEPGPLQIQAQLRVQEITDVEVSKTDMREFNAAVQAENNGDLGAALTQFKALANKPGPMQAQALARVQQAEQLMASATKPKAVPAQATPAPGSPVPGPLANTLRRAVVTLIPPGIYQSWKSPVNKGQSVPANSIDGGLKPIGNLTVPPLAGAPAGAFVIFMISIDPTGNVFPTRYLVDDNGLSPQVMAAAKAWKFSPPTVRGVPVSTAISVKVAFP